jgi:hypothetical protein
VLWNPHDLLLFRFRFRVWFRIQTIFSTVFQLKKMCSKSCISMLEAAFFARKFAFHICFYFCNSILCRIQIQIQFHKRNALRFGSTKAKFSVPQHWGGRVFVLQFTRFQIVCGEEEFKRCRLKSFKLLRKRRMSLSGHRVSSSGGEEFRRYSSQVFRRRLGRASYCVWLFTKTVCRCPFHLSILFNCKNPIYVSRKSRKLYLCNRVSVPRSIIAEKGI